MMKGARIAAAAAFLNFLVVACAEKSGSGVPTAIPQIVVNCTSSACRTNSSPFVYVMITQYNCDPTSDQFATASSSLRINCTVGSGCYGATGSWTDIRGLITSIPEGTYTVCGRIDFNGTYPSITTDDTQAMQENVAISAAASGQVNLLTWIDH